MNWLVFGLVAAVVAGVIWFTIRLDRRHRRTTAELLGRIEELEKALGDSPAEASLPTDPIGASDVLGDRPPTADVLSGRTSHIARVVEGSGNAATSLADQALVVVHRRIDEPLTPNELAETLYVSLRTLERGVADELGCSPRQLILAVKMRQAKKMLRDGRHQVQEVAMRLGFASPSHMSRRFKSFYRVSPSEMIPK
jgi:AraC-like DNA-binding protein